MSIERAKKKTKARSGGRGGAGDLISQRGGEGPEHRMGIARIWGDFTLSRGNGQTLGQFKEKACKSGLGGGERERDEIRRAWKAVLRTLNLSFNASSGPVLRSTCINSLILPPALQGLSLLLLQVRKRRL